ncbi:MAG: type III-A CRISPR-associated RAMP protein Csm5 [Oscillatoria sp. PMC 1068.18]|nr:type III-A CRISPR-associated RAMP protein Csm5 [Oscillatoria sp. PMC 1076.18]MEC4989926.1 type III-A CRISPR-associated RAMP protein Csm5 [Oscillatoria sp. PMC 1068.18]
MTIANEFALAKPKVYESKRIRLISPMLHIGSEVSKLNPFEYVETSNRVYLPNQEALAKELYSRGRLDDYVQAIENRENISSLLKQVFGNNWQEAKDAEGNAIFPKLTSTRNWVEDRVTDLRPMIRNGLGQLYIPGSSIKGAIRTAIAYHLLKHADKYQTPQRVSEIEGRLREKLQSGELRNKFKQKFVDKNLFMESLFSNFNLIYQNQQAPGKTTLQSRDFMRAIKVTDSQPLLEQQITNKNGKRINRNLSVTAEVIVSSYFQDKHERKAKYKAPLYAEMVRNVYTEFTIVLDTEMLQWFHHQQGMQIPFKNIAELLTICQEFAQDQWDGEFDYWQSIFNNRHQGKSLDFERIRRLYEKEDCPYQLRLGWGSGMTGTTISWLFQDETRSELRDVCGIKAPGFEAPKSRRTIANKNGEIAYVPGWVKLKVI